MTLRLSGPRRTVNRLMSDSCVIRNDTDHAASAVLDLETGLLESDAVPGAAYSGKCLLLPAAYREQAGETGSLESSTRAYTLSIPYTVTKVKIGAEVFMTKSEDKSLVGKKLIVRGVTRSSVLVWRQFAVELVETSRD